MSYSIVNKIKLFSVFLGVCKTRAAGACAVPLPLRPITKIHTKRYIFSYFSSALISGHYIACVCVGVSVCRCVG